MSSNSKSDAINYSKFDNMSTEQLEDILKADAALTDDSSDVNKILYILEVLERREVENGKQHIDVDAAAEIFRREYLPLAEKNISLYDDGPEDEFAEPNSKPHKLKRTVVRIITIAAIISVMLIGSMTAGADGFSLWDTILEWGRETFGFQSAKYTEEPTEYKAPEQLGGLEHEFAQYGIGGADLLPTYIPENYRTIDTKAIEGDGYVMLTSLLSDDTHTIVLQYRMFTNEVGYPEYQKNDEDPEPYVVSGIKHYIAKNEEVYTCFWINGNMECSISGVESKEELIKIIDSIYGG